MQIALHNPARKTVFLTTCFLLVAIYCGFAATKFLGAYFAEKPDAVSLQKAIRLDPGNGAYYYLLGGRYLLEQEPRAAVELLKSGVLLNPNNARYWFDLATAYQLLGNSDQQKSALQHAVLANPASPNVAWEAANLYWVEGDTDRALKEFRVVLENDPYLPPAALERCWRIRPDVNVLLRDVVPKNSDIYSLFLDFLSSKKETAAAARVWSEIAQLQQPVERRYVFDYIRYLIDQQQIAQARLVWRQAAGLSDLSDYQPSLQNLVVNGDFGLPVLNGGFDWLYEKSAGVSLALDLAESRSGRQSLAVVFDSQAMEDVGIRQLIPVEPNTKCEFSAYFKTEDLRGAGGPRFVIQDASTGTTYFASDELKDAGFWKQVGGTFDTGPDAQLLRLGIKRIPAGNAIRGKLWIDSVRLTQIRSAGDHL